MGCVSHAAYLTFPGGCDGKSFKTIALFTQRDEHKVWRKHGATTKSFVRQSQVGIKRTNINVWQINKLSLNLRSKCPPACDNRTHRHVLCPSFAFSALRPSPLFFSMFLVMKKNNNARNGSMRCASRGGETQTTSVLHIVGVGWKRRGRKDMEKERPSEVTERRRTQAKGHLRPASCGLFVFRGLCAFRHNNSRHVFWRLRVQTRLHSSFVGLTILQMQKRLWWKRERERERKTRWIERESGYLDVDSDDAIFMRQTAMNPIGANPSMMHSLSRVKCWWIMYRD